MQWTEAMTESAAERQMIFKKMKIDIVDELEAEASYRYFDLFQRAADEIKRLRVELENTRAGATPLDPKPQRQFMAVDEGGRTAGSIPATGAAVSDMMKASDSQSRE